MDQIDFFKRDGIFARKITNRDAIGLENLPIRRAHLLFSRLLKHSSLSKNELRLLLEIPVQRQHFRSQCDIREVGHPNIFTYLVEFGLLGSFVQNADGTRNLSAVHIPGDIPGLAAILQPRALSGLQALAPSSVIRIPTESLKAAAFQSQSLAEALLRIVSVNFATVERWLVKGKQDAMVRIAHLLCELAVRMNAHHATPVSYLLSMTQSQIGEATGLTSVHVNRVLKRMRECNLIDIADKRLVIHDWKNLVRIADFNPDYLQLKSGSFGTA